MASFTKQEVLQTMEQYKFIPLFYNKDLELSKDILNACYRGGVRVFEYTNRGPEAKSNFVALLNYVKEEMPGLVLGIGTILTVEDAEFYINAGTNFIVTPNFGEDVGTYCMQKNITWIPGCMTPTEIFNAHKFGADAIKLFPGDALSPAYVKAVRGPLPFIKLMITGGVMPTIDSVSQWLNAGALCVGLGSHLFAKDIIESRNFQDIELRVGRLVKMFVGAKA
jgi:2-dehydro-3-deoxyphosphogluconate aldolase / (4S)-4-hydroxy-2-oxoglutarate aldolase